MRSDFLASIRLTNKFKLLEFKLFELVKFFNKFYRRGLYGHKFFIWLEFGIVWLSI